MTVASIAFLVSMAAADPQFIRYPARSQTVRDPVTTLTVRVTVDAFELGETEVPQSLYQSVTGANPSANKGQDLPVENVSWLDAVQFANAYSRRRGLPVCYEPATGKRLGRTCGGYRLPTEAEWNYALESTPGSRESANLGLNNVKDAAPLAGLHTRAVRPGDLIGNVWEWCEDWFSNDGSGTLWPLHNPRGPVRGLERVIRGGSFRTTRTSWGRTFRSSMDPMKRSPHTGIRLARSVEPVAEKRLAFKRFESNIASDWFDGRMQLVDGTKVLMMDGVPESAAKRPVVIVPYYDVDTPAGQNLGGKSFQAIPQLWFARHAAQMGYLAVAVKWYGESGGEWYDEAVANLGGRMTGLDRWVADSKKVVDFVLTLPNADPDRIAMIGHSLGGKMTMYAMAADKRIKVGTVSDPGIPPESTNYGDYWYLGEKGAAGLDHHALMSRIAPRPFLLLAGEADTEASKAYLKEGAEWIHHAKGHRPPADVVSLAWEWLLLKFT